MVFCYKYLSGSPSSLRSPSPRLRSPIRCTDIKFNPSAISELIHSVDDPALDKTVLGSIPDKDWKLLAALARKREENEERERLADDFRRLWKKEDEERKLIEAITTEQYQKYLSSKRKEEKKMLEEKQLQRSIEQHIQRGQLQTFIRSKELRSADMLAQVDDVKTTELLEKALTGAGRAELASRRRARLSVVEQWQRRMDWEATQRRTDDADQRRIARLRDASKKAAISNAINSWETNLLRREISAMNAVKRAATIHRLAYDEAKSISLQQNRDWIKKRNRKIAALSARLRETIRNN